MVSPVAVGGLVGDLHRQGALVLGIAGPDSDLGGAELGAPAPLVQAPAQAGGLAVSLAAYGYRDVLKAPGELGGRAAAAGDVQAWVDAALAEPGLVVVHLLTHGLQGRGRTVLYVLGPDGVRVPTSVGEWLNRAGRAGTRAPSAGPMNGHEHGRAALRHPLESRPW